MTLLERITLEHQGSTARATLSAEDPILSGALAALAVYGVKRYITAAKIAEARETLVLISARLMAYAAKSPGKRFPRSAPRVPAKIPPGIKYTTTPADWKHKSWASIEFGREAPQYYSYEYETSKDRKRATVRARGDLDGDGVESLFELDVTVDGGEPSPLRETNPTE
jgi:type IV pilus assembly protein PilA